MILTISATKGLHIKLLHAVSYLYVIYYVGKIIVKHIVIVTDSHLFI